MRRLADSANDHAAADTAITRRALLQVASAVTILTIDQDGVRHGTTVSAMSAMSRRPLILGVCLRSSSRFAVMVRQDTLFSVNVLAAGQAEIARRFADPLRPEGNEQFAGLDRTADELTGAPLIDGCLAHLSCRAADRHQVGDHDLLLAEVLKGTPGVGEPLMSFAGRLEPEVADRADPTE